MQDIETIELSLAHAKAMVSSKEAVLKLTSNREFKKVVLDGYFKEEASRLVLLSADPSVEKHRGEIMLSIQGISSFNNYLQRIVRMGEIAEQEVRDFEESLDEARNTQVDDLSEEVV
jgi:hypothetical protein